MPFRFIKSTQNAGTSVTTLGITVSAVPVNTLVVVSIKFTSSGPSSVSVTDNASTPNTYAKAAGPITVSSATCYQFYGVAITGGATTITVNWTTSATLRVTVDEFSGGLRTNATVFDKVATNTGTGTSASLTLAPTSANELIVGMVGWQASISSPTAGSNYILTQANTSTNTEYRRIGTTSETVPMTWTTSTAWAEIASAFIASGTTGNFFAVM